MSDNEISDLDRLTPAADARDLPAGRRQILKEHLMTEFRLAKQSSAPPPPHRRQRRGRPGPGRRPVLAFAAGAGVLAAAAVAAAVVLVPGPKAGGGPAAVGGHAAGSGQAAVGSTSPGATLLAKIADAAERQPALQPGDSGFMYIRSEVAYTTDTISGGHETSTMQKPHERQIWLPAANICAAGFLIEDGTRTPLGGPSSGSGTGFAASPSSSPQASAPQSRGCGEGSVGDATYRLLQSLPTDPHALLRLIYAQTKGEGPSPDAEAFTTIGDLMRETIVPPRTAAALYRAAALIPGVTVVGHATDAAGQAGAAVAWTVGHDRDEWIFSPATGQFLGERDYNIVTGAVTGESAVLQRAFTAKAGQLP
ncbi:MAG TPA: CU044_5270 family protein [Trebonia sp.]